MHSSLRAYNSECPIGLESTSNSQSKYLMQKISKGAYILVRRMPRWSSKHHNSQSKSLARRSLRAYILFRGIIPLVHKAPTKVKVKLDAEITYSFFFYFGEYSVGLQSTKIASVTRVLKSLMQRSVTSPALRAYILGSGNVLEVNK